MRGAEVVQVDGLLAAEEREAVLEGAVRQAVLVGRLLEHFHLLHVLLGVLVRHDLDRGREELIAAVVVAVRVGVDDVRDRLVAHRPHLVQNGLPVVGQLGVHQHHAIGGDVRRRVPAGAGNHVDIAGHLLNRAHALRGRGHGPGRRRQGWLLRAQRRPGRAQDARGHDRSKVRLLASYVTASSVRSTTAKGSVFQGTTQAGTSQPTR